MLSPIAAGIQPDDILGSDLWVAGASTLARGEFLVAHTGKSTWYLFSVSLLSRGLWATDPPRRATYGWSGP